jgi:excisionase family DNA binding protein
MTPNPLLTVAEACERLRIRRSTFDSLVASGRLAIYRIGKAEGRGKILVSEAEIQSFLDSCRCETGPIVSPLQKGRGARLPLMPKEDHFAKFSRKRAR